MLIGSIFSVSADIGYPALILLVMIESGGFPLPGETALLAAGILASDGKLSIWLVILCAAGAAIVGDNIGYLIGRKGGRTLLERPGPLLRYRREVLRVGEPFFAKYGARAVFFGRFVVVLRTWASWLAGATEMEWRHFVVWNALGGICWATLIGLLAYYLGKGVEAVISDVALYALAALALIVVAVIIARRSGHLRPPPDASARPSG